MLTFNQVLNITKLFVHFNSIGFSLSKWSHSTKVKTIPFSIQAAETASHLTADGQSVRPSGYRAPRVAHYQI
jgi:hypothetical protein